MKDTLKLLIFVLCVIFISCDKQSQIDGNEEEISFLMPLNLGGDFISVTYSEMKKLPMMNDEQPVKSLIGINVFRKQEKDSEYTPYAYGLFDDPAAMNLLITKGYLYKFECTVINELEDKVYNRDNVYYSPFLHGKGLPTRLLNEFIYDKTENLKGIATGLTRINANDSVPSPKTDRFYCELSDFSPNSNTTVNLSLKRTSFALHLQIPKPSDVKLTLSSPYLSVSLTPEDPNYDKTFIYSFSNVKAAAGENYSGTVKFNIAWTRKNGDTLKETKDVVLKPNVKTNLIINIMSSLTNNVTLDFSDTAFEDATDTWQIEG